MHGRIGFVDHHPDNFHANTYLGLIRGELSSRGFTVNGCWALDADGGRDWASRNGVAWFDSASAMDPVVDCYCVLAPSDPELHEELCEAVLPFAKPVFVDKTFAPSLAVAERIYALADRYGAAIQTSSALRYTNVQATVVDRSAVRDMVTWGGGRSFAEYAIHPVELMVSVMGPDVRRLMRRGSGERSQLLLEFGGGRTGVVNVYAGTDTPFAAALSTDDATRIVTADQSTMFRDQTDAILTLFETGSPGVDRAESLAIRRVLDAAEEPAALSGFVPV